MSSKSPHVPFVDLRPQHEPIAEQLLAATRRVLESHQYILGDEVAAFEEDVSTFLGCAHAVGVNSGTDALVIALRCVGVTPGAEVITSPFTFFATAEAIINAGAIPVFADIDPETYVLTAETVERKITSATAAILPVHLFGHPVDASLNDLAKSHDLPVVDDAAQAFGAAWEDTRVGSLATMGCFSFFPSKNLGGFGDGGLITTSDSELAERARRLRAHGGAKRGRAKEVGFNSRLDELQAALLRVKLPYVNEWNRERRAIASSYRDLLTEVGGITAPRVAQSATHVFHQFTVSLDGRGRNEVVDRLKGAGVGVGVYYRDPLHRLPPFAPQDDLPHADSASGRVLSLPIWPGLPQVMQERVVDSLAAAL